MKLQAPHAARLRYGQHLSGKHRKHVERCCAQMSMLYTCTVLSDCGAYTRQLVAVGSELGGSHNIQFCLLVFSRLQLLSYMFW